MEIWRSSSPRAQVEAHVKRLLGYPTDNNPRRLQFFREYFGYRRAIEVFKDPPDRGTHDAHMLVSDLEFLIRQILEDDRQVLPDHGGHDGADER